MKSEKYVECRRCVMNSLVDSQLILDQDALCNHCLRYDEIVDSRLASGDEGKKKLEKIVRNIKESGKGKDYDCIIGVSGGVDSTYVAYLIKTLGLRPLAVHFDNGWNSELAVSNIEKTLKKLDIDLITHVIDWPSFRDLQLAFLQASTPDGEVPTDHAIFALLWREAAKHNIKYLISGMNFATEAMSVPHWAYGHSDWKYIKSVHRRFGRSKLQSYPHFGFLYLFYITFIRRIRSVSILNYIDYDKNQVVDILQRELGWKYYGGKHYESIYTRFYQGYILPRKFGIDKRYGHASSLINSGKMTREEAVEAVKRPTYDEKLQAEDIVYVCKKFGITIAEFEQLMKLPVKSFSDYPNSYRLVKALKRVVTFLRKSGFYPK